MSTLSPSESDRRRGENEIVAEGAPGNGGSAATKTYTIRFRPRREVAELALLEASQSVVTPAYHPQVFHYEVSVPRHVEEVGAVEGGLGWWISRMCGSPHGVSVG